MKIDEIAAVGFKPVPLWLLVTIVVY